MEKKKIKNKVSKKYVGIAKVGYNISIKQSICVKYRFDNTDKFIIFIKNKFPNVCWINIYSNTGMNKDKLLFTWGLHKGLQTAY